MQSSSIQIFKFGLIGFPLGHSLSPKIHAAALESCQLKGSYSLFPIPPEDKQGLENLLNQVRAGNIHGLNVTIPHKQNVIEFLDELTPTAKSIGAVNTIYLSNDRLIGDNTDAPGFLADVKSTFNFSSFRLPLSALILGAGGSARAVVYALLNDGWTLCMAARRPEQAKQLATSFMSHALQITNYDLSKIGLSNISLSVNPAPV